MNCELRQSMKRLAVRADADVDLPVLQVDAEVPHAAVLDRHPDAEVRQPGSGVVASARWFARLQAVDADPQTGMLLVLLPVTDHVRLVHTAPLDPGVSICGLSALSNERNAPGPGGSPPLIVDQALPRRNPSGRPRARSRRVPHITFGA